MKAKIVKSGIYPYVFENNEVKICFMIPSDANYGGTSPQMAKGGVEHNDPTETAIKEGIEELGLIPENIKTISLVGNYSYKSSYTDQIAVYVCELSNMDLNAHGYETSSIVWLPAEEALNVTRVGQLYFLKKAICKINEMLFTNKENFHE